MKSEIKQQRPCASCPGRLPPNSAPQRKYCDQCKLERDRKRQRENRGSDIDGLRPPRVGRFEWVAAKSAYLLAVERLGDHLDEGTTGEHQHLRPEHFLTPPASKVAEAMQPDWCRRCFALYLELGRGQRCSDCARPTAPVLTLADFRRPIVNLRLAVAA